MLKGQIVAGTYTSGYIPLAKTVNTNSVFRLTNNHIEVHKTGLVDVKANITVSGITAGVFTAQLYGNGQEIKGAAYTFTAAADTTYTLIINDVVQIVSDPNDDYATIGIQLSKGCTINGGNFICEYRP